MPIFYRCPNCDKIIFATSLLDETPTKIYDNTCPYCGSPFMAKYKRPLAYKLVDKETLVKEFIETIMDSLSNQYGIFICSKYNFTKIKNGIKNNKFITSDTHSIIVDVSKDD